MPQKTMRSATEKGLSLSKELVTYDKVEATAAVNGKRVATVLDVFMDEEFVKKRLVSMWYFISWEDAPTKEAWYAVDKESKNSVKLADTLTKEEADKIEVHKRFYVTKGAIDAINEKRPLAIQGVYNAWVGLIGGYGDDKSRIILTEVKENGTRPEIANALRKQI
jgi:hypothetical protein